MTKLTRRAFVGAGAGGMAGAWLAACEPNAPSQAPDPTPPDATGRTRRPGLGPGAGGLPRSNPARPT